jgi:hypothetical protein
VRVIGCETQGGAEGGHECKSDGAANEKEITAVAIEADLVYIDQAKHEVGMLLNPDGGVYMNFKCGGELVEASGPFLSPVGPINKEVTSFTATLSRSGAVQTPNEYENAIGEKRLAIPKGKRGANPLATTGVKLGFTIQTAVPLQIKAVTAAEIEARQREDEAAAACGDKEASGRGDCGSGSWRALLSNTLTQCRKAHSKHKRTRCEKRAKKKYGSTKPL